MDSILNKVNENIYWACISLKLLFSKNILFQATFKLEQKFGLNSCILRNSSLTNSNWWRNLLRIYIPGENSRNSVRFSVLKSYSIWNIKPIWNIKYSLVKSQQVSAMLRKIRKIKNINWRCKI